MANNTFNRDGRIGGQTLEAAGEVTFNFAFTFLSFIFASLDFTLFSAFVSSIDRSGLPACGRKTQWCSPS